jgi:hypothetical protein
LFFFFFLEPQQCHLDEVRSFSFLFCFELKITTEMNLFLKIFELYQIKNRFKSIQFDLICLYVKPAKSMLLRSVFFIFIFLGFLFICIFLGSFFPPFYLIEKLTRPYSSKNKYVAFLQKLLRLSFPDSRKLVVFIKSSTPTLLLGPTSSMKSDGAAI